MLLEWLAWFGLALQCPRTITCAAVEDARRLEALDHMLKTDEADAATVRARPLVWHSGRECIAADEPA